MSAADAEAAILAKIAALLGAHIGDPDWAEKVMDGAPGLRKSVMAILAALAGETASAMDSAESKAAIKAAKQAQLTARRLAKIAPRPSRAIVPTVLAPPLAKLDAVREIIPGVTRAVNDILRRTVTEVLIQVDVTSEKSRLEAAQLALDNLTKQGVTGITDRSGRRWNMTTYLEMATRTALVRASTDWYAHEMTKAGFDLAWVRGRPGSACPSCAPFQDKLVSLSGATRGPVGVDHDGTLLEVSASLTEARARGLQHPNCTHRLVVFIPGEESAQNPAVDPQRYQDEQRLRALERNVREAKRRAAVALTPERKSLDQRRVRAAQKMLRDHVEQSGVRRQRHREQLNSPR